MKTYQVGTFYHPPSVSAYLRDYHTQWTGCMVFSVEAETGREAIKKAKALRKDFEAVRARVGAHQLFGGDAMKLCNECLLRGRTTCRAKKNGFRCPLSSVEGVKRD